MNAVATPPNAPDIRDQNSVREWIAELTDFTPQQIENILAQMAKQSDQDDAA